MPNEPSVTESAAPIDMTSLAGWRWFGYAGHFVGGKRCAFHLATIVGHVLVSTLGHYLPRSGDGETLETLGIDPDSYFETMVFRCAGVDQYGNANILDLGALDTTRYADSLSAERGHFAVCHRWHRQQESADGR